MAALVIDVSLGLAVAMVLAWIVQRRTGNAGWVDVVWSFALGAAGVAYALFPLQAGLPTARQWLVAVMVAAWSIRLGLHIAGRTAHGAEDARYAQFRHDWGTGFQRRMFWLLQIQAAAAALLAVSVLLAARNPRPLSGLDFAGLAVLSAAILGEAAADRQLLRFRSRSGNSMAGSATSGCGVGRAIRITSSNGSAGSPTHCWRSIRAAVMSGAGWRLPHRHSCTGCWCTSPASRRWNSRCCARGERCIATTRRASVPSSHFLRRGTHEPGRSGRGCGRTRSVAGPDHPRRHRTAGGAHQSPAAAGPSSRRARVCRGHGAVSDRAAHGRRQRTALRTAAGVFRAHPWAAAEILLLPVRRRDNAGRSGRACVGGDRCACPSAGRAAHSGVGLRLGIADAVDGRALSLLGDRRGFQRASAARAYRNRGGAARSEQCARGDRRYERVRRERAV